MPFRIAGRTSVALVVVLSASCGGDGPTDPPPGGIDLRLNHHTLEIGDTTQAVVTRTDAAGNLIAAPNLTYSSSAGAVATVSAAGVVVGKAPGTALIRAESDGLVDTMSVSVLEPAATLAITPAADSIILPGGWSFRATARNAAGEELFDRRAHWTTSDPSIATVSEFGDVTAVAPGNVTITARLGPVQTGDAFRVLPAAASVVINAPPASLLVDESVQLTAAVYDAVGTLLTGRILDWSASGALGVTPEGLVTARVGGTGTVRVTVEGAADEFTAPSLVDGYFFQVSAGHQHSCALTEARTVYCWGAAEAGQAGQDAAAGSTTSPSRIDGLPQVETLTSRGAHNCGLTGAGVAHCWGLNSFGQLGHAPAMTGAPGVAAGGMAFTQLALGIEFTCGLTAAGAVYCWGDNRWGQLGRGTVDQDPHPDAQLVDGAPTFASIAAGYYSMCGLTAAGEAWCWGMNARGILGNHTPNEEPSPVPGHAVAGLTFTSLAGSQLETCGITPSSTVICWGNDYPGPTEIDAPNTYASLTGGNGHVCGIRTGGTAHCWGTNDTGEGNVPPVPFDRLAAGGHHTCGRQTGGKVICWGWNGDHQLGGPNWESGPVPGQP